MKCTFGFISCAEGFALLHTTSHTHDRVLIIAAILKGEPVDIDLLLLNALVGRITRHTCQLFFFSLITAVCLRSEMRVAADEPRLREK